MINKAFEPHEYLNIVEKLYNFSQQFECFNLYDSSQISAPLGYNRFEFVAAFGCVKKIGGNAAAICYLIDVTENWLFGYINYEAKNELISDDTAKHILFYQPKIVLHIQKNTLTFINNGIADNVFHQYVNRFNAIENESVACFNQKIIFEHQVSKHHYVLNIEKIKQDIIEGTYYEMNYCQKFIAENGLNSNDNFKINHKMRTQSPAPFSAYIKTDDKEILCASPERFLMCEGEKLISQPIKGTNKRLPDDQNENQLKALKNSEKEVAENVMIVDLVRNDLTKVCRTGTIKVEELCGTYAFSKVNQMISTVTGKLQANTSFLNILKALFPMGSMTGAPKIEVMHNIEKYEATERCLYSGCIGYIMPNKNFDFNVVIRTLIIEKNHLHYHTGGAITFDSIAENEYEECLLKGKSITDLFE